MASNEVSEWELDLETVLVKRNLKEATKGSHQPRPLVTPIYNSSTYLLESSKEGETLSMNHAKVAEHYCNPILKWYMYLFGLFREDICTADGAIPLQTVLVMSLLS